MAAQISTGPRALRLQIIATMILLALLSVPRQGTAAEIALRIDDAKQLAIAHAPEVILARYAVEEAETALQAALIGGAFGPAESGVQAAKTKLR